LFFFFQAEDGIRDFHVTGVQTCALPIFGRLLLSPSVGAHALEGPGFRVEDDGPEALVGLVSLPSPRPPGLPETPERVGAGCRLEIGRASCRESVGRQGVGGSWATKTEQQ